MVLFIANNNLSIIQIMGKILLHILICLTLLTSIATKCIAELIPFSNTKQLQENDLIGLTKDQLKIARNEIFARHGYSFKSEYLKEHFAKYDWYKPTTKNVQLSKLETDNVKFIKSYETDEKKLKKLASLKEVRQKEDKLLSSEKLQKPEKINIYTKSGKIDFNLLQKYVLKEIGLVLRKYDDN